MAKDLTDDVLNKVTQIIDKFLVYPTFFDKKNEEKTIKEAKKDILNSIDFIFDTTMRKIDGEK